MSKQVHGDTWPKLIIKSVANFLETVYVSVFHCSLFNRKHQVLNIKELA